MKNDSSQSPAAIDHQHFASDETGVRVAKEAYRVGNVVDAADAAHWDSRENGFPEFRLL